MWKTAVGKLKIVVNLAMMGITLVELRHISMVMLIDILTIMNQLGTV